MYNLNGTLRNPPHPCDPWGPWASAEQFSGLYTLYYRPDSFYPQIIIQFCYCVLKYHKCPVSEPDKWLVLPIDADTQLVAPSSTHTKEYYLIGLKVKFKILESVQVLVLSFLFHILGIFQLLGLVFSLFER